MDSRRLADAPPPARRRQALAGLPPPVDDTGRTARDLLLNSWPGRLFIIATIFKIVVSLIRIVGDPPRFIQIINTAATIGLAFSALYFVTRFIFLVQRRLLWRVRRKLILSYIFIGVIPALLILGFFMLVGWAVTSSVGAYLFRDGYDDVVSRVQLLAEAASAEVTRSPKTTQETIERVQRNGAASLRYPALSLAFIPADANAAPARVSAGPWEHLRGLPNAEPSVPGWLRDRPDGFTGTTAIVHTESSGEPELVVRSVRPVGKQPKPFGWVVAELPIDGDVMNRLFAETGVKVGGVSVVPPNADTAATSRVNVPAGDASRGLAVGQTVSRFDAYDWGTGDPLRATVALSYKAGDLFERLSGAQSIEVPGGLTWADAIRSAFIVVAVLFLIIQLAALVMGLTLARSITSSVHELFMGTERVRQGDFTHRISISTKDQLGELAGSFNQMTGSIENLLLTAAEKKRMQEELRIARQIQMSLLPRGPLDVDGLAITALCVPAREVGGDYYDFFPLEHDRLGVLIADVSGKGTSAALYMAELKGLVLSLSQIYQSPRQLLIEANRILAENLDSRSFITITYAMIDLKNRVMTYARAGHTPLIYLPGNGAGGGRAQVLIPNGMVVGLRIDGAAAKFNELLEEQQINLTTGDVIVFYTDGITEAMNQASDLFGESRLGRIIEEHGHLESGELRERILREIEAFVGTADQHDDMTMILMKVTETEAMRVAV